MVIVDDFSVLCIPAVLIGLIPAEIARSKGHNFWAWWLFGAALFIVALPAALLLSRNEEEIERRSLQTGNHKKCPYCAEIVRAEAVVCKHCGRELTLQPSPQLINVVEEEILSDGPLRLTNWRLTCDSLVIPLSTVMRVEVAEAETGFFVLSVLDSQGSKHNLVQWPTREPADNFANAIENAREALFGKKLPA
jgi:hypothetical protein